MASSGAELSVRSDRLSLPSGLASRAVTLLALVAGGTCIGMLFTAMPPILHQFADHFGGGGLGQFTASMMMTMAAVGLLSGGLIAGALLERLGARRLLVLALVLYGVLGTGGLYLDNLWAILAARTGAGVAAALVSTCTNVFIGGFFDEKGRGRMIAFATAFGGLVSTGAVLASGRLAAGYGWQASFILYALVAGVMLLAALLLPAAQGREAEAAPGTGLAGVMAPYLEVLRLLWAQYVMIGALYIVLMMTSAQIAFLLRANGITDPVAQSQIISPSFAFLAIGALTYGWLQGRVGSRRAFELGLVMLGGGIAMLGLVADPAATTVFISIKGLGSGILNAGFIHLVLNAAPPHLRGRAIGLMLSAQYVGDFLNPLAVQPVSLAVGINMTFALFGTAVLAGWLVSLSRRPATA